jgi:hypothetical protein
MGYYINAHGTIEMVRSLDTEATYALKALNYQHELKRGGGGRSDDPFEAKWFSWMPPRYHEDPTIDSVEAVLAMLGFDVTMARKAGLNVYTVTYENKTGQEEVFLNTLAGYAQISIDVTGEDGARWRWVNAKAGAPLEYHEGLVTYKRYDTVAAMVEKERQYREEVRRTYA